MTLVMMLTVAASGTVGRYVKGVPHLHMVWSTLHLPLVFILAGALVFHIIASFIY